MDDYMNGRDKCRIINSIRRKVADNNNIDFVIYDCTFEGECSGSCQKTASELNYLEGELEKIQSGGVKLNLEGVFTLDDEIVSDFEKTERAKQEKLDEIMKNPELNELPPRYLDMLL